MDRLNASFSVDCTPPVVSSVRAEYLYDLRQRARSLHKVKRFVRRCLGVKEEKKERKVESFRAHIRRTTSNMTIAPSSRSSGSAYSDESSSRFPMSTPGTSVEEADAQGGVDVFALDSNPMNPRRCCSTLPVCLRREWRSFSPRQPNPPHFALPDLSETDILNCVPSPPSPSTSLKRLYISTNRAREGRWTDEVLNEAEECVDWVRWLDEWWRIRDAGEAKQDVVREWRRARKESLPAMRSQLGRED